MKQTVVSRLSFNYYFVLSVDMQLESGRICACVCMRVYLSAYVCVYRSDSAVGYIKRCDVEVSVFSLSIV